jgi:hypothetical protein
LPNWYFTFFSWQEDLADKYLKVPATTVEEAKAVIDETGLEYFMIYDEKAFIPTKETFKLTELV